MITDHSKTYRSYSFRNIPHIARLWFIRRSLIKISPKGNKYADFGCSNGYVTRVVLDSLGPSWSGYGFDISKNIGIARNFYPEISFDVHDLNSGLATSAKYDFVTCFETLEHVGDLERALQAVLHSAKPGGVCYITVPVEYGLVGLIKFLLKSLYGDDAKELCMSRFDYLKLLFKGNIRDSRSSVRSGYSTHYGFDGRLVDEYLVNNGYRYKSGLFFTTRYFIVYPVA